MTALLATLLQHPIIPVFLLANLAIGLWAHMKSKAGSFEDYALASRNLPTGVLIMTLLGTFLSSEDFAGVDRFVIYGLVQVLPRLTIITSFLIIGTFIAPNLVFFKKQVTAGSLMATFYGRLAQLFTGIIGFLACLLMISFQVSALGKISSTLLPISFPMAVTFFGGIVVLYSIWGGIRTVSYTDVLQTIAVLVFFSFITHIATAKVGGIVALIQGLKLNFSDKLTIISSPNLYFRLRASAFWGLSFSLLLSPPIVQRMLITRDKREVRYMWYVSAFIIGITTASMILISFSILLGKQELGLIGESDLLPQLVRNLFSNNPVMLSLMLIGMISVVISTIDSYLNSASIVMTEDIIEPIKSYLGKSPSKEEQKLVHAKIGTALIGIFSIIGGLQIEGSLRAITVRLLIPTTLTYAVVNIPLILGIIGLKTNRASWISFFATYFGGIGMLSLLGWRSDFGNHGYYDYFLVCAPLGILVYFISHIYINGGIVTLKRSQRTIAEQLWIPSPSNIGKAISGWLRATFNLSQLAKVEVYKNRPAQSLRFSMLIFFLYTVSSIVGGSHGGEGFPEFMAAIHFVGIALCCGLMLEGIWPSYLKPYFPLYWLATLFYCLPLSGTITFLRMHEGLPSVLFFMGSFVLQILLVSSRAFVWMSVWGLSLAHLVWYLVQGSLPVDLYESTYLGSCLVLGVLIVCVPFFGYPVEQHAENRLFINRALSDSVAHETLHHLFPMRGVSFFVNEVDHSLEPTTNAAGEKGFFLPEAMRVHVEKTSDKIDGALDSVIEEFINFKDIIHSDLYNEMQEKAGMVELVEGMLPPIMKRYEDMLTIKVVCKQDFEADVIRPFFGNVLGNIARNAHLHGSATELEITIDGERRRICMRDNGNGIQPEVLPRIFDLRFTTLKKKGSGVGLALVKLILALSGITINCHSRYGDKDSFTEFVIDFPPV